VESSHFGLQLDLTKIRLPDEIVVFESKLADASIILNPELGTFTKLSPVSVREIQKFRRGEQVDTHPLLPTLAKLIVERIIYYGDYRPVIDDMSPAVPASVYWETTHGCSLRCVYCYMSADTVKPGELTTEEAKHLIAQVSQLGSTRLVFTGGEALIRKDIFELGQYALSKGLSTEIITNATLVTSLEIAHRVKQSFNHVIVSLDGACPEHNDLHRGQGSFDLITRGMKLLNAVGIKLVVNSVASEANVAHISDLYELIDNEFEVADHRIMPITHIGRGKQVEDDKKSGWNTYHQLFEQAKDRLKTQISSSAGALRRESFSKSSFRPRKNCGMGSGEIYVDSQGRVYPCKLITTPEWFAGSLRDASLKEILQRSPMRRARDHSVTDTVGCRSCIIRRLCGGGCRGFHLGNSGDAFTNDPNLCWTLRHGMITNLWLAEKEPVALDEDAAYIPRLLASGEVWQPELGTALPDHILHAVTRHLDTLADKELPLA
jgi:radical SAM protein with 4Fe4S-binding SPASM domain